jgi:hypothetical protein
MPENERKGSVSDIVARVRVETTLRGNRVTC